MASSSPIEWTNATWNPATGCTKVSPGCKNCYAEKLALRWRAAKNQRYVNGFDLTLHEDLLDVPLRWKKPKRIFVNSMSDMFHEELPVDFIRKVFATMERASWHTFQILTKRAERLAELAHGLPWPPNVWMGVSIESERYVGRADRLREVPAAVRFLSLEPLLEALPSLELAGIDWVIVGGESGGGARPMQPAWARELRDRCVAAGVPFFMKQWGRAGNNPDADDPTLKKNGGSTKGGRSLDGRVWDEYPDHGRRRSGAAVRDVGADGAERVTAVTATFLGTLRPRTRALYDREIRRFQERLPGQRVGTLTHSHVRAYLVELERAGLGPSSRALALCAIRSWLQTLVREGFLAVDPTTGIRAPVREGEQRRAEALTRTEVERIVAVAGRAAPARDLVGARDRALLLLGFSLGLRVSELVRLRVGDVKVNGTPCLAVVSAKSGRAQLRLLNPGTCEALRAYLRLRGRVDAAAPLLARHAPGVSGQQPVTPQWVGAILRARATAAGIQHRVSPQDMRLTYIQLAAAAGAPVHRIQRSVGHASVATTWRLVEGLDAISTDPAALMNFSRTQGSAMCEPPVPRPARSPRGHRRERSTSTVLADGTLVPWLAASGELAYTPEAPPTRDSAFQYGWVLPQVLRPGNRRHCYFGTPIREYAREVEELWAAARRGSVDRVFYQEGRLRGDTLDAPIAVYRQRTRLGRDEYLLIQHGSYQSIPVEEQPLLSQGFVLLHRGLGDATRFRFPAGSPSRGVEDTRWPTYLELQRDILSRSDVSFNSIHDRAKRAETGHINDSTWMTDDLARACGLEIEGGGDVEALWSAAHQSFALASWVAERKFGPSRVVCKTPVGNIRITTFFAGEHEARIIDPGRVEVVEAVGCTVDRAPLWASRKAEPRGKRTAMSI